MPAACKVAKGQHTAKLGNGAKAHTAQGLYVAAKAAPASVTVAGPTYNGTVASMPVGLQVPITLGNGGRGLLWRGNGGAVRWGSRNGTRAKAARHTA